ncbi:MULTISPECIES: tRNA (guanosine(46)-N7)-methyltransferase TrmB [unclassified Lactococcus]|uniref:tRNA (guanosine(46)-N7)-methyltransferase TrmB n=1 Tax=unclassified Lactococcus TaxID=2643510 RepID=UPI0011C7473B|nr:MULTISPECIES: tRNA (guanosine(46)-N7)-methyltransferase TrmB [unclassified Lactococcus]MQW22566.1 tRNA (guanosine(46)-N7)-methyltransferase TrmB [Lactococcus sp. dk101]TXK45589.1 tRNA (guanosine(46)-N7)-methyltransferase TrmB [Lactococcus sp. dk310]TXK51439.1 tRNA (guanosine(46)-N7)-methyltransferase TrmB [Lactococcus sp. dk322]
MRVKHRKGASEHLKANTHLVVENPADFKGRWSERFGNQNPIHIEIGSGKGAFIVGMAALHPEINYVAIDLQLSVLSYALDRAIEADLPNIQMILVNGSALTEYFADGEVDQVYLNFSDPWPKTRHEKRRLTYKSFLATDEQILKPNGEIHFKTDNRSLFEYSLVSMTNYGMKLKQVWLDLHADEAFAPQNVMTEYEQKFSSKGQVIYRLEAQFVAEPEENSTKD